MNISRRGFIKGIAALIPAAAIPFKFTTVPSAAVKDTSAKALVVNGGNGYMTPEMISKEALSILEDQLIFTVSGINDKKTGELKKFRANRGTIRINRIGI